ncbi:MAG: cysteine desulfurase [Christensenellaceae bacterium]|nr:cysteine desulfurase [Christensenellaceae bacterium]
MSIYLDNAATTRPFPGLEALFKEHMETDWYNPSAMYPPAVAEEGKIKKAKETVASLIGADPACTVFNACGTEGANTVIFRGYRPEGGKKRHFITSAYEHPCVYECFRKLEEEGHSVDYILPAADGSIHPEQVAEKVGENTALVSIMHVNNETGAINDVAAIAAAVKAKNPAALVHADGVQAYGKIPLDFGRSALDYYTASAHKLHGLKGTGVLFYKKGSPLKAYLMGGGQEKGLRSGTENTFGILAFAAAAAEYKKDREAKMAHMRALKERLLAGLSAVQDVRIFSPKDGAPHILNLAFTGMRGEVLLHLLEQQGIYISTGSACSSKKGKTSRVHKALGVQSQVAECVVRISFCPENTLEEMDTVAQAITAALKRFRGFIRR